MADGLHHHTQLLPSLTKDMARVVSPCQLTERHQSHAEDGWQGADATSMTPRCSVCCRVLNCSMLTRVFCVLFFCCICTCAW